MKNDYDEPTENEIEQTRKGRNLFRLAGTAAVLLTGASVFSLTGCNTMEGAGEDVQAAGEAVEDAAYGD